MDVSYNWIKSFVPVNDVPSGFMKKMNMSGTEIKGYRRHSDRLNNIAVGKILEIRRHPNADKLVVCKVDVGEENPIQIVTAATNVFEGALVPVALHNSLIYDGTKITKGKLRGEESLGMFCSVAELGITTADYPGSIEDGILILKEGTPGQSIVELLHLDDVIIEADIVTNRPDCLSIIGLAREVSATYRLPLNVPAPKVSKTVSDKTSDYISVSVSDRELCKRYTARVVKNVKIGPSPLWMIERLRACGVRAICNIVDITNYVMLEYGQPMHAFDYACLDGKQIVVRKAQKGEVIKTLDGSDRPLEEGMLVIADEKKPVALAGIMGGFNSEIKEDTSVVVFESANFLGSSVRRTANSLGMRTESSSRFEKMLDPQLTSIALERACELVVELGAGEVCEDIIDLDYSDKTTKLIGLDCEWINKYLNTDIKESEMAEILSYLGLTVENGIVKIPSFRSDLENKYDISEEVARFYGYDNIKPVLFKTDLGGGGYTEEQKLEIALNNSLRSVGLTEASTYSFMSPKVFDKLRLSQDDYRRDALVIKNPIGEETSMMRTTMVPSMMDNLIRNISVNNKEAFLYEIGKVYLKGEDVLPHEKKVLVIGIYDSNTANGGTDFFTVKGMLEKVFAEINTKEVKYVPCTDNPTYHPGRTAEIVIGQKTIGVFGQVHPLVVNAFDANKPLFMAEIDLEGLFSEIAPEKKVKPIPKYPASTRDIALVCSKDVYNEEIIDIIKKTAGKNLKSVKLFDIYTGAQVGIGNKSMAYSLVFRKEDATLLDKEVDAEIEKIIEALNKKGIYLRS